MSSLELLWTFWLMLMGAPSLVHALPYIQMYSYKVAPVVVTSNKDLSRRVMQTRGSGMYSKGFCFLVFKNENN